MISGGKASAIWYSIAETAKANNLKQFEYFKYLLEEILRHSEYGDKSYLEDLLPWSKSLPDYCRKKRRSRKRSPTTNDHFCFRAVHEDSSIFFR